MLRGLFCSFLSHKIGTMKNLVLLLPLFLVGLSGIPQTTLTRAFPVAFNEIPLATSTTLPSGVGPSTRDADHATVAMNSNRDILVAFHTSRPDITGAGQMKQVEIAFYEYQSNDTWDYVDTYLLGGIDYNPIGLNQAQVKCERPDVIAVGDRFFVVWTRRYDSSIAGQGNEPAILECAWVKKVNGPTSVQVTGHQSGSVGRGFELDAHVPGGRAFEIRECAGVPDAVALNDPSDPFKVAVVYPHQFVFSSGSNLNRKFALRMVTCSLDAVQNSVSKGPPEELHSTVVFNGDSAPGGGTSAGLILPDLAPSSEVNSFWVAAEGQVLDSNSPQLENGRIRLEYWQENGGTWDVLASKTFKSPNGGTSYMRRRPMISSFPAGTAEHVVSIAFSKGNPDPAATDKSANVVHEQWEYENGSLISPPSYGPGVPPETLAEWPNSSLYGDGKPVALHGRTVPYIRRCFATRALLGGGAQMDIMSFDDVTMPEVLVNLDTTYYNLVSRPAAAYHYHSGAANPDYITVTWEKIVTSGGPRRIWIGLE